MKIIRMTETLNADVASVNSIVEFAVCSPRMRRIEEGKSIGLIDRAMIPS